MVNYANESSLFLWFFIDLYIKYNMTQKININLKCLIFTPKQEKLIIGISKQKKVMPLSNNSVRRKERVL